jgi:acyl phosphate:glycerol-3-phosphate acyltransferase
MQRIIPGIIVSYLIGSIPTAYIFGRLLKGIDIRNFGSGNVGATNALRVLGKKAGITVLIIDVLKGLISVLLVSRFMLPETKFLSNEAVLMLSGISCICGHNWTIFLRFKGGKGIATSLGVLLGLSFKIAGLKIIVFMLILTWFLVFVLTKIVSISSVIAGISMPIYAFFLRESSLLKALSLLLCIFVLFRHKANLIRLFQGKEPRLFSKKS